MNSFRNFMKKFSNFKLTAIIVGITGLVGAVISFVTLFMQEEFIVRLADNAIKPGFFLRPIEGMFFFVSGILALILGVVVAYLSFPHIFKREKQEPNKALVWLGVAQGGLTVIQAIFAFIMTNVPEMMFDVSLEKRKPWLGWFEFEVYDPTKVVIVIILAVFLILVAAVELAMMYPALTVRIKEEKK